MRGVSRWVLLMAMMILQPTFAGNLTGIGKSDGKKSPLPINPDAVPAGNAQEIKIGLLLPEPPGRDPLAKAALEGAELAISMANKDGGYKDKPYRLIIRTADGLWGAGSKEAVKFVHEDQVVAILTALDGRNAHLAEQVAAKSHIVQLCTRATEETLSQAFVPWFFRIVPNDRQQAEVMVEEIFRSRKLQRIYAFYEDQYDYRMGAESFEKAANRAGFSLSGILNYNTVTSDPDIPTIEPEAGAVVVFGSFDAANPLLEKLRKTHPDIQVFGSLSMTFDGQIGSAYSGGCEGGIFIASKFCYTTSGQEFKKKYIDRYGHMPSPAASFAFDGANLIIEAVRRAGPDREGIRDVLREIKYNSGATGPIEFDPSGNRIAPVFFIRMIKGHPVIFNP